MYITVILGVYAFTAEGQHWLSCNFKYLAESSKLQQCLTHSNASVDRSTRASLGRAAHNTSAPFSQPHTSRNQAPYLRLGCKSALNTYLSLLMQRKHRRLTNSFRGIVFISLLVCGFFLSVRVFCLIFLNH